MTGKQDNLEWLVRSDDCTIENELGRHKAIIITIK